MRSAELFRINYDTGISVSCKLDLLYYRFWFSFLKSSNHFIIHVVIDTGLQISKASGNDWEVLQVILGTYVMSKFGTLSFQECFKRNHSPGLLHRSNLQTKEDQRYSQVYVVGFENSETVSTSIVWPSDHRKDDRSCAWSSSTLYRPFMKHCALANKAIGTIWRALSTLITFGQNRMHFIWSKEETQRFSKFYYLL